MPEFDSERLKKLIEAFKSAEEQVQTVLLNTKAESVEDYKFKVEKKLDKVSVSLMKESIDWAEKDLPKAYREGEKRTDTRLEGSHAVAFGKLSDAAIETPYIELARHTQYANDYQKKIIDDAILEAEKDGYGATVSKVKDIIQDTLAKDNASMIVQYSNGAKMPLEKYAEMLARTSRIETANKGSFDRCRKLGIDLVRCTKVPNCCPYCQMYEDKVYSISGNDTRFPALYETALQRGYDIMHPNCRHEFIPFIEEFYTDEEMQELIKNSNHFEELSPDNRIFKVYNRNQALLRQWNEERHAFNEMKAYYKAKGEEPPYTTLGGFRRSYRAEKGSEAYKKSHDWKVAENKNQNPLPPAYNKEVVDSENYIQKFNGIGNKLVRKTLRTEARDSIKHADMTNNERGAFINANGEVVFSFSGKNSSADYAKFDFSKHKDDSLVLTHNHPHGKSFSVDDILTLSQHRQIKTIVATGHDGSVYSLSIGDGKRVDRRVEREYNTYMAELGNDTDLVLRALSEKYGWRYSKK